MALPNITWDKIGKINIIIGENSYGKTSLLKAMYSAIKSIENYKRGDNNESISDIISKKLYWTFQSYKIGNLVKKKSANKLEFNLYFDNKLFSYSFGKNTIKQVLTLKNNIDKCVDNSIFIPSKEILSVYNVILKSRELDKDFGFDDTFFDIAVAIKRYKILNNDFLSITESIQDLINGKIIYSDESRKCFFKNKSNQIFSIETTADSIKKIGVLDILLSNNYLTTNSIVFIDELESSLHPNALLSFIDIIFKLSNMGNTILYCNQF